MSQAAPLDDAIVVAIASLVDDKRAGNGSRAPTHLDLAHDIERSGLSHLDPGKASTKPVGKYRRVYGTLTAGLGEDEKASQKLAALIISTVRGHGGFRPASPNYSGAEAITNLQAAYRHLGWDLSSDGVLMPRVLESLEGKDTTIALKRYADRARRGATDDPLIVGTGKDLLEATAAHVLLQKHGTLPQTHNFPVLLAYAFEALGLQTGGAPAPQGEPPRRRMQRAAFDLALSLNALRNKEGTGHGRPWEHSVTTAEAMFSIEGMGNISAYLLDVLSPPQTN